MPRMTNQEYVNNKGTNCPFCGSENITVDNAETDGNTASQTCYCSDCNSDWEDIYKLQGYNIINDNSDIAFDKLFEEVLDDTVDTCLNDVDYMKSLLRDHFNNMSHNDIRKLHHEAFGDKDE